jgi:hypothetical protein
MSCCGRSRSYSGALGGAEPVSSLEDVIKKPMMGVALAKRVGYQNSCLGAERRRDWPFLDTGNSSLCLRVCLLYRGPEIVRISNHARTK